MEHATRWTLDIGHLETAVAGHYQLQCFKFARPTLEGGSACLCCNQIVFYGEAADSSKDVAAVTGRSVHICNCHSALGKVAGDPTWLLAQAARQKSKTKDSTVASAWPRPGQTHLAIDSNAAWNIESGMLALSGGGGEGLPGRPGFCGSRQITVHSAFRTCRQPCPLHLPSLCFVCQQRGRGSTNEVFCSRVSVCVCLCVSIPHPAPHCDR